jgi:hypothetical protein
MTDQDTTKHDPETTRAAGALSIEFDPAEFMHFLADTDWDEERKAEYITLVWNIVCEFVVLGFDVQILQQTRKGFGKQKETGVFTPSESDDMVDLSHQYLSEDFLRLSGLESVADEEGVINE